MAMVSAAAPDLDSLQSVDLESGKKMCSASCRDRLCTIFAYTWFGIATTVVADQFSDQDFSAILTLSAAAQCFGLMLLLYKVAKTKTVSGLSARSLEMYVGFFLFRLSSSLFKNGYIPVDRSGDWVYQATDIVSLLLTLQLLYCLHVTHRSTYQEQLDTVEMWRCIPACILVAIFIHGDLNDSPFFDIVWTVSLNLDTVALIPQLWMVYKLGERQGDKALSGLNAHYVAAMVTSRFLAFWFWFHGFPEIAPLNGGANTAGWLIISCHSFQLLVSADFMLQYLKALWRMGQETFASEPAAPVNGVRSL
jgi:hypothetical protein